ncbi:amp-dependent synthetase and ligase [Striga asiatica]|uniref:Amp-dependent synthetase and ligase n=1 Tax=Striga asiatica TaxID=4170 RepID=A0A5A7QPY8_STRAF|nr:amp-dependent synthetase and ligase [Striga asiatica]
MNTTFFGTMNPGSLSLQCCTISASSAPFRSTTNAHGLSPHLACGIATTAASPTAGYSYSAASTSTLLTFSPPDMITSLHRSLISTYPSGWTTPTSPVCSHPSPLPKAARVASSSFKYPFITPLPLSTTSPIVFPSRFTLPEELSETTSTSATVSTLIPCLALSLERSAPPNRSHLACHSQTRAGPVASVRPYAWVTRKPSPSARSRRAAGGGDPPTRTSTKDVEDDGRTTHVGDFVEGDGVVDFVGTDGADADVGAAACRHAPREGPTVAVEHGEGPQVDRLRSHPPTEDQAQSAEVGAAVAINSALGLGRRGPRRVVEGDRVPLVRHHILGGTRRVAAEDEVLVLEGAEAGACRGGNIVDDCHEWRDRAGREEAESVSSHRDVLVVDEE